MHACMHASVHARTSARWLVGWMHVWMDGWADRYGQGCVHIREFLSIHVRILYIQAQPFMSAFICLQSICQVCLFVCMSVYLNTEIRMCLCIHLGCRLLTCSVPNERQYSNSQPVKLCGYAPPCTCLRLCMYICALGVIEATVSVVGTLLMLCHASFSHLKL